MRFLPRFAGDLVPAARDFQRDRAHRSSVPISASTSPKACAGFGMQRIVFCLNFLTLRVSLRSSGLDPARRRFDPGHCRLDAITLHLVSFNGNIRPRQSLKGQSCE